MNKPQQIRSSGNTQLTTQSANVFCIDLCLSLKKPRHEKEKEQTRINDATVLFGYDDNRYFVMTILFLTQVVKHTAT